MTDRMEVRISRVAGNYWHQYIIYTRNLGELNQQQWICEGRPSGIYLTADCIPFNQETRLDRKIDSADQVKVLETADNLFDKFQTIQNTMTAITNARLEN